MMPTVKTIGNIRYIQQVSEVLGGYRNPPCPGYYYSHVSQQALIDHKPILYWDGSDWTKFDAKTKTHFVQGNQVRYWCELSGGAIHLSR